MNYKKEFEIGKHKIRVGYKYFYLLKDNKWVKISLEQVKNITNYVEKKPITYKEYLINNIKKAESILLDENCNFDDNKFYLRNIMRFKEELKNNNNKYLNKLVY